jgi:hypothetical protein
MNTESATNVLTRQWRIATYSKTVTPRNRMPETGASGSVGAPLEQSEGATRQQAPPYGRSRKRISAQRSGVPAQFVGRTSIFRQSFSREVSTSNASGTARSSPTDLVISFSTGNFLSAIRLMIAGHEYIGKQVLPRN